MSVPPRALRAMVAADIGPAADRALAALDGGNVAFDLATQIASLLGVLAPVDDAHAAGVAEILIAKHVRMLRTLNEVAWSLRFGTGPATLAVVERLAESQQPSAQQLARRRFAPPCVEGARCSLWRSAHRRDNRHGP